MSRIRSFQIEVAELTNDMTLSSIGDIVITSPADNDILIYDSASGTWKNEPETGIPSATWGSIVGTISNQLDLISSNIPYDDSSTGLGVGSPSSVDNVQTAIERLDTKRRFKITTNTGIITGGKITNPGGSPATFDISDGNGTIIDAAAAPGAATGTKVSWTGLTNVPLTMETNGFGTTYIFINSSGAVVQSLTKPNSQTFIDNIFLGVIFTENFSITSIVNTPSVIDSTANNFNDYVNYLGVGTNLHGVVPIAIGAGDPNSVLEFYITEGTLYKLGVNWHNDIYNPNIVNVPARGGGSPLTGVTFDYILGDGTVFATNQTVLNDTVYDDGTNTPGTVPDKDGLIQFIIELTGGKTYVQPHTQIYRDWNSANSSLQAALSSFVLADEIKAGIIVGAYVGQSGTTDWERGDRASITGFSSGGAGGSSSAPVSNVFYIDITTGTGSPLGVTDTALPSGWTTTYNSIGNFTITHSLGDATVGLALNVIYNGTARVLNPTSITTNSITFQITDTLNAAVEGNVVGKLLF